MARRQYKRLTAATVRKLATRPGMHPDGDGLYLKVGATGVASWVLRYLADPGPPKRERYMGLGPLRRVGLADARQLAEAARRERQGGADPIEARRALRLDRKAKTARAMTFRQCTAAYIAAHAAGWRSPVHARQWPATLEKYAFPGFGALPVAAVDTALVVKVLQPIWNTKTETASRLRGRIESVLAWAVTAGARPAGDNPARWRGHLENLLAKPSAAKRTATQAAGRGEHHAALPYADIGGLVAELRRQDGTASRALEFAILTAARTGETIGARWQEIDRAARLWIVPAERMKGGKEHRVPLADAALAILDEMAAGRPVEPDALIFAGATPGRPLGPMALRRALRGAGERFAAASVHGLRSSFRDWAAEREPEFPAEIAELALAHRVGNAVENAYRRSDLVARRGALMARWAQWCGTPPTVADKPGRVVAIGARPAA